MGFVTATSKDTTNNENYDVHFTYAIRYRSIKPSEINYSIETLTTAKNTRKLGVTPNTVSLAYKTFLKQNGGTEYFK